MLPGSTQTAVVPVSTIRDARFTAVAELDGTTMSVHMEGTADADAEVHLGSFFRQVQQGNDAGGVSETIVDLRNLAFMSSSCFKHVLTWVMSVNAAPSDSGRTRIHFIWDGGRGWQRRGLRALTSIAGDVVTLEECEEETS
jgi:hypothetical protein